MLLRNLFIIFLLSLYLLYFVNGDSFSHHGLFWGKSPDNSANIVKNGVWQTIKGANMSITLSDTTSIVISYEIMLEGLRNINNNPLPRENNFDVIQIRCLVDGIPYRFSSGHALTYGVEERIFSKVSNIFVVNLKSNNHDIVLQWKKSGSIVEKWLVSSGGINSGYSLIAHANYQSVTSLQESDENFLYTTDIWKPLTKNVTVNIEKTTNTTVSYSLTVQPQLLSFIKDRLMEFVTVRALVNGIAYTESGETYGTNAWNPISSSIRGVLRLPLPPGKHIVTLQWKKLGKSFKGWASNPSFLDGFAASRNIIITTDRIISPYYQSHDRQVLSKDTSWSLVNNKYIEINLIKESGVLFTYALPVTQAENPNFDSNTWKPLTEIQTRLVIDGIAYTYAGNSLMEGSRKFEDTFAQLGLVLPAGIHTVALQWKTDTVNWTTLNDIENGFAHGEKLLTYISTDNSKPTITLPSSYEGFESTNIILSNISIDDIDDQLVSGYYVQLNISIEFGTLSFPNQALLANDIEFIHTDSCTIAILLDSISNINLAIKDIIYHPIQYWNGQDMLLLSLSDQGNIGNGTILTDQLQSTITILPVDNYFTLHLPTHLQFQENQSNNTYLIGPIFFNDIDSQSSNFKIEISSTCGFISFQYPTIYSNVLTFLLGDITHSKSMIFYGNYDIIRSVLTQFLYLPDTTCMQKNHPEIIHLFVQNMDNVLDNQTHYIVVDYIRELINPQIKFLDFPRWSLSGVKVIDSSKPDGSLFNITYFPSMVQQFNIPSNEVSNYLENIGPVSHESELIMLSNQFMNYAFTISFSNTSISLLGSNYIQANNLKFVFINFTSNIPLFTNTTQTYCQIDDKYYYATILDTSMVACQIVYQPLANETISSYENNILNKWMKVVWFDDSQQIRSESTYVSLFLIRELVITALSSSTILSTSQTMLKIETSIPQVVSYCIIDNQTVSAYLINGNIHCQVPIISSTTNETKSQVSLYLTNEDMSLVSNIWNLTLLSNPSLTSVTLMIDENEGNLLGVYTGTWDSRTIDSTTIHSCLFDGYETNPLFTTINDVYCPVAITPREALSCCQSQNCNAQLRYDSYLTQHVNITCDSSLENYFSRMNPSIYYDQNQDLSSSFCGDSCQNSNFTTIFPTHGPSSGNSIVTIHSINSLGYKSYHCLFGNTSVPAILVSENDISCVTPSHIPVVVDFQVLIDGLYALSKPLQFTFTSELVVSDISPSFGSQLGGNLIYVYGENFGILNNSKNLECYFGEKLSPGTYINDTTLTCVTPSHYEIAKVSFALNLPGVNIYQKSLTFQYIPSSYALKTIFPASGYSYNQTIVIIKGANFSSSDVNCIFGEKSSTGIVVNSTTIYCTAPPQNPGVVPVTLDFGFDLHMNYLPTLHFTYLASTNITSLVPSIAFLNESMSFSLTLDTLLIDQVVECQLGSFVGVVNFEKFTYQLKCDIFILDNSLDNLLLNVMIDSIPCNFEISNNIQLIWSPKITSIYPTVGISSGGDIIRVSGQGFQNIPSDLQGIIRCQFGQYLTPTVLEGNEQTVACFSPSFSEIGSVVFNLMIHDKVINKQQFNFTFVHSIHFIGMKNLMGPMSGNTKVYINGLAFPSNVPGICHFGFNSVSALWINNTHLECLSPPSTISGVIPLQISFQGYNENFPSVDFTYLSPPTVNSYFPTMILQNNNVKLIIQGEQFLMSDQYNCIFQPFDSYKKYSSVAQYINSTSVSCSSTPLQYGEYNFTLSSSIFSTISQQSLHVLENTFITDIFPLSVPISSSHTIKISGVGLNQLLSANLSCEFDGQYNSFVIYHSDELLTCLTPKIKSPGRVSFRLIHQSSSLINASTTMYFFEHIRIFSYSPKVSSTQGKQVITINGYGFFPEYLYCHFGDIQIPARYINETSILCTTPNITLFDKIDLSVSVGKSLPISVGTINYRSPLIIQSVSPLTAFANIQNKITIQGEGFSQPAVIYCTFGSLQTSSIYVNDTILQCVTPTSLIGTFSLFLSTEYGSFNTNTNVTFTQAPAIYSISPTKLLTNTTSSMSIYGDFSSFKSEEIFCMVNDHQYSIQYISSQEIVCLFDIVTFSGSFDINLLFENKSLVLPTNRQILFYHNLLITDISRVIGPSDGGFSFLLFGTNLPVDDGNLNCMFNDIRGSARLINMTSLECYVPALEPGSYVIGLSIGNTSLSTSDKAINIIEKGSILSISPDSTSPIGGIEVFIQGSGFYSTTNIVCRFGTIDVLAIYHTSSVISCFAPSSSLGTVTLKVLFDDMQWYNPQNLVFNYVTFPTIYSISPQMGSLRGNQEVTIFGDNFLDDQNYYCHFGSYSNQALVLSSTSIVCTTPAVPLKMTTEVYVSSGKSKSSVSVSSGIFYRFVDDIFLFRTNKYYFNTNNDEILVSGNNFPLGINTTCWFSDINTLGSTINSTTILCPTPTNIISRSKFNLKIEFIGFLVNYFPLEVESLEPPVISQIAPVLISPRTQFIEVMGSFPTQLDSLYCAYNDKFKVLAKVIGIEMIHCDISSLSFGDYNVSVELNGIQSLEQFSFSILPDPLVTSIVPSLFINQSFPLIQINGLGFQEVDSIACSFDNIQGIITILNDQQLYCLLNQSISTLTVQFSLTWGTKNVFFTQLMSVSIGDLQITRISPLIAPIQSEILWNIEGNYFYSHQNYQCKLNNNIVQAIKINDTLLQCVINTSNVTGTNSFSIMTSSNSQSFGITLISQPVVRSLSLASYGRSEDNFLLVNLVSTNIIETISWDCVLNNISYSGLFFKENQIICDIPQEFYTKDQSFELFIRNLEFGLFSNKYEFDHNDINFSNSIQSSIVALPQLLFGNETSYYTLATKLRSIYTTSYAKISQNTVKLNPTVISSANLDYTMRTGQSLVTIRTQYQSSNCIVNDKFSCVDDFTLLSQQSMPILPSTTLDPTKLSTVNSFLSKGNLILDNMFPRIIDSHNGTWVTIQGRNFDFETSCYINNHTVIQTIFVSEKSLSCHVPRATQQDHVGSFISVKDSNGRHSLQSLPYFYDRAYETVFNLSFNETSTNEGLKTNNIPEFISDLRSSICLSKVGCIDRPQAELQLGLGARWLPPNQIHNISDIHQYNISAKFTKSDNIQPQSEEQLSDINEPKVLLVSPPSFSLPCDDCYVIYLGYNFAKGQPWCLNIDYAEQMNCHLVYHPERLFCDISSGISPERHRLELLSNCVDSFYNHTMDFYLTTNKHSLNANDTSQYMEQNIYLYQYPILTDMQPKFGWLQGGTKITFTGLQITSRLTNCIFSFDNQDILTESFVDSNNGLVSCLSPPATLIGNSKVSFVFDSSILETQFVFEYRVQPQLYYVFPSKDTNTTLIGIGSGFQHYQQLFCQVIYSDDNTVLLFGRVISNTEFQCYDLPLKRFEMAQLSQISISFNNFDYMESVPISSSGLDKVEILLKDQFYPINASKPSLITDLNTIDSMDKFHLFNPPIMTMNCNKHFVIPFVIPLSILDMNYTCYLNHQIINTANMIVSNRVLCEYPMTAPGKYSMTLVSENNLHAPVTMELYCEPDPKVFSAKISHKDNEEYHVITIQGLNFKPSMSIQCLFDNVLSYAIVDSSRTIQCVYQHLIPSSKSFSIHYGDNVLLDIQICLDYNKLSYGGDLLEINELTCEQLLKQQATPLDAPSLIPTNYRIRNIVPQSGITFGNTIVKIIADQIVNSEDIFCLFDDISVMSMYIDDNTVICRAPSHSPGNVTLSLTTSTGNVVWCCKSYYYYPILELTSLQPNVIYAKGGSLVTLHLHHVPTDANLYCHFDSTLTPAIYINDTTVQCRSPLIFSQVVNVSLGSYYEEWSNRLMILVSQQDRTFLISPDFGSVFGNTNISLTLPSKFTIYNQPYCKFGSQLPVLGQYDRIHNIIYCNSSPNDQGKAIVNLIDGDHSQSLVFYAGTYTYLPPATILSIMPRVLQLDKDAQLFVSGEFFYDSHLLTCLLNQEYVLPVRWLSESMIACDLSGSLIKDQQVLNFQVSNNGLDLSNSFVLTTHVRSEILSVSPSLGFVSGNTQIKIHFKKAIDQSLYCDFNGTKKLAYSISQEEIYCITPRFQPGPVFVSVIDRDGIIHGQFDFNFIPLPTVTPPSNQSVLFNLSSTVQFQSSFDDLHPLITGRLKTEKGTLVKGTCVVFTSKILKCSNILVDEETSIVKLELTINHHDYVANAAVVPVHKPSKILWLDPLYTFQSGGGFLRAAFDKIQVGESLQCVFTTDGTEISQSAEYYNDDSLVRCIYPPMNLRVINTFSIYQHGNQIYGPSDVMVIDAPLVESVSPLVITKGAPETLVVKFEKGIPKFPSPRALFQGYSQPLRMISNDKALVSFMPIESGIHPLQLLYGEVEVFNQIIGMITVIDFTNDLSINITDIASGIATNFTIQSKSCSLTPKFSCSLKSGHCSLISYSNCSTIGSLQTSQKEKYLDLTFCASTPCIVPIFSHSIYVLSPVSVITSTPSIGSALGGATVKIYGNGFTQDSTLNCLFGSNISPAFYISSSLISCILPSSTPGKIKVHVSRRNVVVSTSMVTFDYIPAITSMDVTPLHISSLGGTIVTIQTHEVMHSISYQCRFNEKYVSTVFIDSKSLVCQSPALNISEVEFAISINQADLSPSQNLKVTEPLNPIYIDPTSIPANTEYEIMILFDRLPSTASNIKCLIDGHYVSMKINSDMLICFNESGLAQGNHVLSLEQNYIIVYTSTIVSRSNFNIDSVFPLSSFTTQSISVSITITKPSLDLDFSMCCFGEYRIPASQISFFKWQCYSPTINFGGEIFQRKLPFGLSKVDGFCEYSGFDFVLYPGIESVNEQKQHVGSVNGGASVFIPLVRPIKFESIYCRIGTSSILGQYITDSGISCISPSNPPGNYSIDVSVNGLDFLPSGHYFQYLPRFLEDSDSIQANEISRDRPKLFYLSESSFPTGSQFTVTVMGQNFGNDSICILGQGLVLDSKVISTSEIQCVMPIHSPGQDKITVMNNDGQVSEEATVSFTGMITIPNNKFNIDPLFGPRTINTLITLTVEHLDLYDNDILCLVGDEWSYSFNRTNTTISCQASPSYVVGRVAVRLANKYQEFFDGIAYFEYIDDPMVFDIHPKSGTVDTDLLIEGIGFYKFQKLSIQLNEYPVDCKIISNTQLMCPLPTLSADYYTIFLQTNGQHLIQSGITFEYFTPVVLEGLWPLTGPALKGNSLLTIRGSNFPRNIDVYCVIDENMVPAYVETETRLICRIPPHRPGLVAVSVISDGIPLHPINQTLQFQYVPDVSVDKISPEFGYTAGEFPVFVFGSNFINTTSLGCKFADMKSRAIYLTNNSLVCLSPSPLGRPELAESVVAVEVTVNGYDYSESGIEFTYSQPCDQGFFCPGMTRQLCPNGTYCPVNSRNFTLCEPGTFQPMQGQIGCVTCPIGYICPDMGMPRPINCPPGLICDIMGLRASAKLCPAGQYCLNGTKSSSISDYADSTAWVKDYVTGVYSFNESAYDWSYHSWPAPAVGKSRPMHPPEMSCDGLVCSGGSTKVLAEAPFPCPIGHYCRPGAGTQIPMPKNFSSPQRCFDGFFCPRGSVSPEGSGPCPNGYFCPTQLDAIICPAGHYCPGVGNQNPIECYPGTYNPFQGRANCTVCPTGHICPGWGLLLPEPCPAGFVCLSLGLSYPVVLCPQGYRCDEGTLTLDPSDTTKLKPQVCKAGEFCLGGVSSSINVEWIPSQSYGVTHPQLCSEGTYCQAGAYLSSGSGLCFKGHYCPPNSSFPIETPVGNFASGLGSVAPTLCYPGTYAPLTAQIDCLVCPSGHTCTSYGTYIPTICGKGTYRSQVDSVTCAQCPTGTYSFEVGSPDLSLCLPCPKGRICGVKKMYTLASSSDCPAGYICGYGTDRSSQFSHLAPAGFHTASNSNPEIQYDSYCKTGYYCARGTPTYMQYGGKCPVGYFCPRSSPQGVSADIKCPYLTTTLSGSSALQECRVDDVDVCDKAGVDSTKPMEDLTYYPTFSYELLDGSNSTISFDSSTSATTPTGEVLVSKKIYPVNISASSSFWVNDTIEAFRACPLYGSGSGGDIITIIGRNFRDTGLNFCKFRPCISANLGAYPGRCKNQIKAPTGEDLSVVGVTSNVTFISIAKYISSTRMECTTPEFLFDSSVTDVQSYDNYECAYLTAFGEYTTKGYGNFSYIRTCYDSANCADLPTAGKEFFISLTFACSETEILAGTCSNTPEPDFMMNPCMSTEVVVEVTNDGEHYSGGVDLGGFTIVSTSRYGDGKIIYNDFKNTTSNSTVAVFTYVYPDFFYTNDDIMAMERRYCSLPRYSEEADREREKGWFQLEANEVAHLHIDFAHIPSDMVYDEHYRIALFIQPSRCTSELCSSSRVRLSPEEYTPCKLPKELSFWFQQTNVPKNVKNNLTIFALDDLIFKVEIHILYGLYTPYGPLFDNTTIVRIASPARAKTFTGMKLSSITTRTLSPYISFEERVVPDKYYFCAVVYQSDSDTISQPLNLPPLYSSYERGRALIMNNVTIENTAIPLIKDQYSSINQGVQFWLMPATTPDESKELLDAYFETFQDTTYDSIQGFTFSFDTLVISYLPYFSNCYTFDSYIPFWLLFEGKECELPDYYDKAWFRYKFPALPDQDDIKFVGPFDFFEDPISDWCERDIYCTYEEELSGQDNTPRWFELSTGTTLFQIIRSPLNYYEYTGRKSARVSLNDPGGGAYVDALMAVTSDNFIPVSVDHTLGDTISGCIIQCFARSYTLKVAYFQEDLHNKRIITASLVGDNYDFDQENDQYSLHLSYYPLGFLDLILNFAFPLNIFIIIFIASGILTVILGYIGWLMCRITTLLQNPPKLKIIAMLPLIVPPPAAGVTLATILLWIMTSFGNYFINGYFYTQPDSPSYMALGTQVLDVKYPLEYGNLGGVTLTDDQMQTARYGRIGSVFAIVGFFCLFTGAKMYFPREESKRERDIAKKRTDLAKKHLLWNPILWKKANFIFSSFILATFLVLVVELSYWTSYGDYFYQVVVMLTIFGEVVKMVAEAQLNDSMLVAPLVCGWTFVQGLVAFGAPDFLSFMLSNTVDFAVTNFSRVFQDTYLDFIFTAYSTIKEFFVTLIKSFIPKYFNKGADAAKEAEKELRKRAVDGVVETGEESESVEPILEYFADVCSDTMIVYYFPYFVYLLMQYRTEIKIPDLYGIRQSDMMIYMVYQLFLIVFQPFLDIYNHSQCELFHGWKIYEYLVYSRYRFLQRETRWKGMETSLDECIEERLRRLDQMCFSSQYFLMLTVHVSGIIYIVLAYEVWLRYNYSPFSDSGFFLLFAFLFAMYLLLQWSVLFLAIRLKVWKIKHENTAWHLLAKEEDDLDVPAWEEIKGASTEAFLMNQRITSETFRYKFLNYNRTWLINQLPQILTPRTMRRSRPYLINQFARIINARRDDVSDDSDGDHDQKFGPVALTAPSRNIIRFWLGKAKRRIKLRNLVEPLIKRARGVQCEQCLSRKQLQVECEVDIDDMAAMYDKTYPGDEEVDQVQWKSFWVNNQRYHTICLSCITKRKEINAREKMKNGLFDPTLFDDDDGQEAYPDWGPVFLSAPSKAMLLNWYRKAQKLRAGKKKAPRQRREKVVKDISDDEGDDPAFSWLKDGLNEITPASKAIAIKWMRTARARLQQKRGKGAGSRDTDIAVQEEAAPETFKSGRKSKMAHK